jgi:RNA polymerase sigma-70 factor (ECF subfamily)
MCYSTPLSLLDRLRGPTDQEAWSRFVRLYTPLFFCWARRLGLAGDEAREHVHEVFVLLMAKMPFFIHNGHGRFRAWLWTVFRNRYRQGQRKPDVLGSAFPAEPDCLAVPDSVAEWVEEEYQHHLVRRAVQLMRAEFPDTSWRAFWEYVVAGRPPAEVAGELGVSVDVVYQAKTRILRRLRQDLAGLLD